MAVLQTNELLKENLSRKNGLHRLTDEETEAIKKVVLEAALDVIALCDENGIPYMLGGGSALGAVRHGGFIPWDDDIDLNIPRKYIPQLIDAIENRYPDKYYIEAPLFTEGYLKLFYSGAQKEYRISGISESEKRRIAGLSWISLL